MDRREFVKMGALGGSGVVIGAVITKCGDQLMAPKVPKLVGLDLAAVTLTKDAYKGWLRRFHPKNIVGTRGSEIDCPTARFATFQAQGLAAIVLQQQHAFAGGVILANPIWLRDYVRKLDAAGPDGSAVTRLEAQKLL